MASSSPENGASAVVIRDRRLFQIGDEAATLRIAVYPEVRGCLGSGGALRRSAAIPTAKAVYSMAISFGGSRYACKLLALREADVWASDFFAKEGLSPKAAAKRIWARKSIIIVDVRIRRRNN